jgi:hypothetical protein
MARQVAWPSSITSSLELRDTADQHPEQQDERSPHSQVQWDGLVGEAPVKLLDVVAFSEQPRRLLARGKRHRQIADQAAVACPLKKVTYGPAGGGAVSEPLVQIRLREVAQGLAAVVEPGQQANGGQDTGPREIGRSPGEGPAGGVPASAAEHEPVHEGPDQAGRWAGLSCSTCSSQGSQAFQVLVACGQGTGADQYFPDVAQGLVLRQAVEQLVGDQVACPGQVAEQPG